jgi:hypothetical protein
MVALALNISPAHAETQPHLTAAQLIPAIDAVLEGQIEERRTLLACVASNPKGREAIQASWETGRRDLRAMLWATNFPADYIKRAGDKTEPSTLDKTSAQATPDTARCADPVMVRLINGSLPDFWTGQYQNLFASIGVAIPQHAPSDAQWAAIRVVFEKHLPAQAEMLNCIALLQPRTIAFIMNDWADLVQQVAALLLTKGYPREEVIRLITAAEPNALLKAPADRACAGAECEKPQEWQNRMMMLQPIGFKKSIREIVEGKR